MNLNERDWKDFKIENILNVSGSITTHPSKLIKNGSVPRITCSSEDNGFDDTYKNKATEKGHVLTVDSATIGTVFYQEVDFIATDHVEKITLPNTDMNRYIGLFLKTAIENATSNKYGYGYKFSQNRIKTQIISLPVDENGNPDYNFMESYMREKENKMLLKYKKFIENRIPLGGEQLVLKLIGNQLKLKIYLIYILVEI